MYKSYAANAAKRIFNGTKKIVGSAGAEAGQEYLQTWHEILAPVASGDSLNEFVTTAAAELGKDANQTEAIVGSILGFSAGGVARGATTAPGVALGTAKDVAIGTAVTTGKAITKGLDSARVTAGLKLLNEDDRKNISAVHKVKTKVFEIGRAHV